jgi:roadblock/LC7 domain-containing protein
VKRKVWKAIPPSAAPKGCKIINATWAMKKKAMGALQARVTARGFMQIAGVHYDPKTIAAPVTNEMTICIILTLMIMAAWLDKLLDVKGAFLHGDFGPKEAPILMKIPQGFKKFYPKGWLLLLLKTICGLKQAVFAFWKALLKAFRAMNFERSKADPCFYYLWTK